MLLGSGKGAAMVACVAEKCSLIDSVVHDEENNWLWKCELKIS